MSIVKLEANLSNLDERDRSFAISLIKTHYRRGGLTSAQAPWVAKLLAKATGEPDPNALDLSEILARFDAAAETLRHPKVAFRFADIGVIKLVRAGERAKVPGSINVTDGRTYPGNVWYGRIDRDGTLQPSPACDENIRAFLVAFNADPASVAAGYGKESGACCFCTRPLTDARSTAVGYGPTCAGNYGLPWGAKPE